jgi:DNA-binding transcriptional ArsR family regulator
MDNVFHALAHGARREMIGRLADADLTIGELAEPLTMSLAAASKHIHVLERAGLVRRTVVGRRHVCRLDGGPLVTASAWINFYERHWHERLDALQAMLEADPALEKGPSSEKAPRSEETPRSEKTLPPRTPHPPRRRSDASHDS